MVVVKVPIKVRVLLPKMVLMVWYCSKCWFWWSGIGPGTVVVQTNVVRCEYWYCIGVKPRWSRLRVSWGFCHFCFWFLFPHKWMQSSRVAVSDKEESKGTRHRSGWGVSTFVKVLVGV